LPASRRIAEALVDKTTKKQSHWIPAFAGMTSESKGWIAASAGMTSERE
jgi:hypothetical protein